MSAPFNIDLPTNVRFGTGVRSEILPLLEEHGWQNVLVIASERTLEDSVSGPFIRELASAVKNLSTFTQIRPNPRISDINDCYLQYVDAGRGRCVWHWRRELLGPDQSHGDGD